MKQEVQIFENPEFGKLRTIEINGAPWFVAKDIAAALGYSDTAKAIRMHCKGVDVLSIPTDGGLQSVRIIPESDLYRLILKSHLHSAEKFQDWVTEDVLPSIRKTGRYVIQGNEEEKRSAVDHVIEAAKLFKPCFHLAIMIGCDRNAAAVSANTVVNRFTGTNILRLLGQSHLESETQTLFFTPTELGARIGAKARRINMLLAEAGLQARKNDIWVPLAAADGLYRIIDSSKRHSDGSIIQQIKWSDRVLDLIHSEKTEAEGAEI